MTIRISFNSRLYIVMKVEITFLGTTQVLTLLFRWLTNWVLTEQLKKKSGRPFSFSSDRLLCWRTWAAGSN